MIKIVNFPFCNFSSVARMLKSSGNSFTTLQSNESLSIEDVLILPGVGSFQQGMLYLQEESLISLIQSHANSGGKIIAICLGLQLLFCSSSESPGVQGLKILNGIVDKIPATSGFSVPHIGWNSLCRTDSTPAYLGSLFDESGISLSDYYFVHSYYALPSEEKISAATITHPCGPLDILFIKDNVFAFQFHPEKSGPAGYSLLLKILDL